MGYYDNQQVASFTGRNAPYDVKDILLGTNAVTGGVDKLVANAAAERVSSQQDQANQYISSLLSNTNTSNYDVNMAKMRTLLPFASKEMVAQTNAFTNDINNKNNLIINQQNSKVNQQNADTNEFNSRTNATSVENTRKYQADEIGIRRDTLQNQREEFQKQQEQHMFDFTHLSSEQKAQLAMEGQRVGISAQELYLRKKQIDNDLYKPVTIKQYGIVDGKQVILGENPVIVNVKTGQILGQGASGGNNVDTLSKSLIPKNNITQTIYPKSMPMSTDDATIGTRSSYSKTLYPYTGEFDTNQELRNSLLGN
jgi:hypothetical protein